MAAVAGGVVVVVGFLSRGSASTTPTSSTENENAVASPNDEPSSARTLDASVSVVKSHSTVGGVRRDEPDPVDAGVPDRTKVTSTHASKRAAETTDTPGKARRPRKRTGPTKQEPTRPIVKKRGSDPKKPVIDPEKGKIETSKPLWGIDGRKTKSASEGLAEPRALSKDRRRRSRPPDASLRSSFATQRLSFPKCKSA